MSSSFQDVIYRWRVRVGFFCLVLAVLISRPTLYSFLAGIGICIFGLLIRTWASGHLRKEKELTSSGPYQFTRNPLYLGNLIIGTSVVIASWSLWLVPVFAIYFLLFYPVILIKERNRMKALFPEEYEKYKKNVPFFFPLLRHRKANVKNKFSWEHYKKNKELRALIGAAVFWAALTIKLILLQKGIL